MAEYHGGDHEGDWWELMDRAKTERMSSGSRTIARSLHEEEKDEEEDEAEEEEGEEEILMIDGGDGGGANLWFLKPAGVAGFGEGGRRGKR